MSTKYFAFVLVLISSLLFSQDAKPVFKDGEAQIVEAFNNPEDWIRHDLWVEAEFDSDKDGKPDRLHVSVTRPKQTDNGLKLPVVYVTSPYFAGVAPNVKGLFWDVKHELGEEGPTRVSPEVTRRGQRPIISNSHIKTWVPRGFIVVHSSSPGTGLSDGAPTVGAANEALAPKAVIDWLCGRTKGFKERTGSETVDAFWSTGKVGMTGTSYNGALPSMVATTGVEGLEAIIPIAPVTSWYNYYRTNGLVRSPGGYLGEDADVLYDFIHSGDESKRDGNNARVRDTEMKDGLDRKTGDYNKFWDDRNYIKEAKNVKAAVLMSHGFNDWNVMTEHSYQYYDEVRKAGTPHQIYYHQRGHGGPPPMKMMNRWFTKFLHGVDNGVEDDPKAWIVREDAEGNEPTPYADFPNPAAEDVNLYLTKDEGAGGGLKPISKSEQGVATFSDDYRIKGADHAKAKNSNNRLLFKTPTLKTDLHISGEVKVTVKVAADKVAANLSVWMVSLPWNDDEKAKITENIITRGWADPQNAKAMDKSSPLKSGEFVEVTFKLMPDDQIIKSGQQIGLMIFSSDNEFTIHPEPGTKVMVDLDGTQFSIPVVGGKVAYDAATK
jgi:X-Pro dipeptidyl-peptidase